MSNDMLEVLDANIVIVLEEPLKQEEQKTIYADTNRSLSLKDLVSALDQISHPTEREDIPLPFDPDDYPVV